MDKGENSMSHVLVQAGLGVRKQLDAVGSFLPQLALRLFLAYEFWVAGVEKYQGTNWFADIQSDFPFPFNIVPADISWQLATWFELIGAAALVLGLATRFFSVSLAVLTLVAWAAVHAGHGYNVCERLQAAHDVSDYVSVLDLQRCGQGQCGSAALAPQWIILKY